MSEFRIKQEPVDKWIIGPMTRFLQRSTTSGILLFSSAALAMILSNSPWKDAFHHFWETSVSVSFGDFGLTRSLHHWINDGLMAVFFFVVGLELKREIIAGELRNPKNAVLPLAAAVGGMFFPAVIYSLINPEGDASAGWGIPMATDIAFALGVLYLLGDRVPVSLKIFLTALAIADDLGAVLVIAFFYTSDIQFDSLAAGAVFMTILITANRLGVRNPFFYGIIGIGGLWLAFLVSGVHATIAAVLAAFTIPATVKVNEHHYATRLEQLVGLFRKAQSDNSPINTEEQLLVLEKVRDVSEKAMTPLQRLEHSLHPLVAFIIMPVFALSNAGITLDQDVYSHLTGPVAIGVFAGLLVGKLIGVMGMSLLLIRLGWAGFPEGVTPRQLLGAGFLSAIGFTMSLFVAGLALKDETLLTQAKLGILSASILASFAGYFLIRPVRKKDYSVDAKKY
jgi:Na+:H+ antiporter, NhaA family